MQQLTRGFRVKLFNRNVMEIVGGPHVHLGDHPSAMAALCFLGMSQICT